MYILKMSKLVYKQNLYFTDILLLTTYFKSSMFQFNIQWSLHLDQACSDLNSTNQFYREYIP